MDPRAAAVLRRLEVEDGRERADALAREHRLRSVTPEQIRVAARRYFDLQRYTRLALMPERP